MPSDSLETLHDLFVHELRDLYDAENQLLKALPLMAGAAQSPELKRAFDTHLRETKEHVRRLERVFKSLDEKPSGKSCAAMRGLVEEGQELLGEDADPEVMDAALIVAAQKVEHYEIASYGSVCTFGRVLGYDEATEILKQTMADEERTDQLLTGIAQKLNIAAKSADEVDVSNSPDASADDLARERPAGANRLRSGNRTSAGGRGSGRSSARRGSSTSQRSGSSRRRSSARSRR